MPAFAIERFGGSLRAEKVLFAHHTSPNGSGELDWFIIVSLPFCG